MIFSLSKCIFWTFKKLDKYFETELFLIIECKWFNALGCSFLWATFLMTGLFCIPASSVSKLSVNFGCILRVVKNSSPSSLFRRSPTADYTSIVAWLNGEVWTALLGFCSRQQGFKQRDANSHVHSAAICVWDWWRVPNTDHCLPRIQINVGDTPTPINVHLIWHSLLFAALAIYSFHFTQGL